MRGPVFSLGGDSAGLALRFTSDTSVLGVRWKLRRERIAMNHMPATGVSGLDLCTKISGEWRWIAVARPDHPGANEAILFANQPEVATLLAELDPAG